LSEFAGFLIRLFDVVCHQVPSFTNYWPEVDIQRDDEIASSSHTETLSRQRQGGVHWGRWSR